MPERPPNDYFFPKGALDPSDSWSDEFRCDWYSKHLRAMEEPSLSHGRGIDASTYRFLWLRTFHNPISVRIQEDGPSFTLSAVQLDGAGGYDPGKVAKRVKRTLPPAKQQKLIAKLNGIEFWKMETTGGGGGLDGAQWILEGVRNAQYHVVDRWSPDPGDYRDTCLLFLELAGFSIPSEQIY